MALYDSDSDEDLQPLPMKAPAPLPNPVKAPTPAKTEPVREPPRHDGAKDVTMKFLAAQLQQGKRNTYQSSGFKPIISPVVDLSARNKGLPINMRRVAPVKARPLSDAAPLSFLPKAATDDSFMMFGEIIVKNEYQPAVPNDFVVVKKRKEEREAREKVAREVAERLSKEHEEEAMKREKGAAIAPPPMLMDSTPAPERPQAKSEFKAPPPLPAFGKGATRGLGVAANIMSKYGYKEGEGLGRDGQGINKALSVERLGRNTGAIINESALPPPAPAFTMPTRSSNTAAVMTNASKVLLMTNMVGPDEIDSELESDIREEMGKYGQVNSIYIHKVANPSDDSEAVRIFVEFTNNAQSIKAYVVMNGRFFGGRQVVAKFYNHDAFENKEYEK